MSDVGKLVLIEIVKPFIEKMDIDFVHAVDKQVVKWAYRIGQNSIYPSFKDCG